MKHDPNPSTTSIRNSIRERWQRLREEINGDAKIQSLQDVYVAELRELHSAAVQFSTLADEIWIAVRDERLAQRLSAYAVDLRSRALELQTILKELDRNGTDRTDEAMQALAFKASRTAERYGESIRDAALAGALQVIMHYMIAEHGTLAAHARVLGRTKDAECFGRYATHDKTVDAEISDIAVHTLNVQAAGQTAH
ncbi:MAG: DUF892 family protein [Steroidobacteraceae bacterium]